ncbi:host specificity protein [Mesorhizobium sp. NBSH29]|uniref:baseplate multidomain protein megatron n=1 Tax=Mesorhizobium sp. NBSH29 TaxID=2654249 RepID=UPI0018964BB1|nr:glycoside hydrolase/phage tail family protein [Mesorhizobium sp. NBSH29]QPC87222.1 host specificity protein [Mesorhizobium sp. NBSH29]
MATIVLQVAGAFLGSFLGPVGTAIGSAAGAMAGYTLDRALISSTQRIQGPRLTGPRPYTAEEGTALPRLYGTARLGGTLIWATRFEEQSTSKRQGSKGGPKVTEYTYFANVAFALCEGEIAGVRRVWADGKELDRETVEMRVYRGSQTQAPDPLIEARQGGGNAPAYRGTAYVVFERLPINDYGNRIPQLQFEVLRPVGELERGVKAVCLIPGSTEFGLAPNLVTRGTGRGDTTAMNRNVFTASSDLVASLDELQALCPNLEHIALVVAWFGNDLRAGNCTVKPGVTDRVATGLSQTWKAGGLTKADAPLVTSHNGGPAYGGSPSDQTVIDAITHIRNRGLKVTLYPFVMMDIPAGNGLPDPYSGGAQAPYPWRGRITCFPGPQQGGTADKTAAGRGQVEAFSGNAIAAHFSVSGGAVVFGGSPSDWGYRRMVLHYARLAALAGGVDAFLVGSELRGLTRLRDQNNGFPFVEQLAFLAGQVRTILPAAKITYGADWTEYFGYHPPDGSGDVYFHLDALWAHPAIDAIGIDNYMPLSDWRDADYAGTSPDGFSGPYDPAGLRSQIDRGEGFDWYYASDSARTLRQRSAITDGAYAKPWVYRYKDLHNWWGNNHYHRVGGVQVGAPTGWVPRSKPIWLTELGCPAVDKGPNQPNVFPDPKSAESAAPYFSSGGQSELAMQRFIVTHQRHWDPASTYFDPARNPISPNYGGRMVDASRVYLWAWDARPFPAFPLNGTLWRDGDNWRLGHWLNGRLGSVGVDSLINAILADHGLPPANVNNADGLVQGYVVTDPASARATLEPLLDLFGIAALETGSGLVFRSEAARSSVPVTMSELIVEKNGAVLEAVRVPDHQLPTEVILGYRDPFADYQAGSARRRVQATSGTRQETIGFSGVLAPGGASALLDDWLARAWSGRETVSFALPAPDAAVEPGTVIRLPDAGNAAYLVTQIEDGMLRKVSARKLAEASPAANRSALPPPPPPRPTVPGKPLALFLDLPMTPGAGGPHWQLRVAAWNRIWRTQIAFASPEQTGFAPRATISAPATLGTLTAPLAGTFAGRIDRRSAVEVHLLNGELASISRLQLLNGANVAALRALNGQWEVLQFESAVEVASDQWRLTGLLRGQLGTIDAMAAGAATNADFVLLDGAVRAAGLTPSECGLTINWRVGPSGYDFSDTNFAQQAVVGGRRASLPLPPAHLNASQQANGDLAIAWKRRGRIDADSWDGLDIPLGEEAESYRIQLTTTAGAKRRTVTVTTPSWTYTAASIAADFGALPAIFDITVTQLSAATGWGLPATRRVTIS